MATEKSSAPLAHPSTENHDDTVEAHYACLEHPCCCLEGWIFLGRLVESFDDLEGEVEVIEAVPCKRCNGEEFLGKLSGKLNTPKVKQE
jgi:hypothetical protein